MAKELYPEVKIRVMCDADLFYLKKWLMDPVVLGWFPKSEIENDAKNEAKSEAKSEGKKTGNNENEGKTKANTKVVRDLSVDPLTAAELATIAEAVQVQYDIWYQVARWAKETNNLNPFYRKLSYSIGQLRAQGREPSIKQATYGLVLLKLAYQAGFHPS